MHKKLILLIWGVVGLGLPGLAVIKLGTSLGSNGIDALKLHQSPYNLTGRKIAIGQVEIGSPGMFGWDKAVSKSHALSISGVFLRNGTAKSNTGVDAHAYKVAAVMVSQDKALPGIAPQARLYAAAVGATKNIGQPEECLSAQQIAAQNGGDVRAINFSFGESFNHDPRPEAVLDGNALLTLCVDWSSRVHDTLYAIAGNQGKGGIPIPTDNFNGITVAFSTRQPKIFNKVDVSNLAGNSHLAGKEFNLGERRTIGLVAPGSNILALNIDGKPNESTGTSFAAPHVTATVALLQEFGDRQIRRKQPHWTTAARHHQVMKAVLLNSADKLADQGDGLRLGMTRTLIDKQNHDWLASDAYENPKIPLDAQMGAGHLNAFRAYQQFSPGEWKPSTDIPAIGWDYNSLNRGTVREYSLAQPLRKNSFVAITLVWDRLVELENQQYHLGDNFRDRGFNHLGVYLVRTNANSSASSPVCSSLSNIDNIGHIFCPVLVAGNYKIRVNFRQQVNRSNQTYALAWWTLAEH